MLSPTSKIKTSLLVASLGAIPLFTYAASDTWDGDTDALWSTDTNWVTAGVVPGTGDTATFNAAAGIGGATTIDLGAGVTVTNITFDTASAAGYTIGAGAVGTDTLTLESGITLNAAVANDQTFNADIAIGDGTVILQNDSSSDLIIAGDIVGISSANTQTLRTGGTGDTIFNGGLIGNTTGLFSFDVRGTTTLNGALTNATGNQRVVVRAGGTLDVSSTGSIGGDLLIYDGSMTLNSSQTVANLQLGHDSAGKDATLNLASGVTIASSTNTIKYLGDNGAANAGLITGLGTIALGANTEISVDSHSGIDPTDAELTIASGFTSTGNFDVTKTGAGTLLLTGTNDTSANGINRLRIDNGVVQIEQDSNLGDNGVFISDGSTEGVLEYIGAGGEINTSIRNAGSASTNATLRANGTGAVNFSTLSSGGNGEVMTLDGSSTDLNLISANLGGNADTSLTKAGTGTWVLAANQTYAGTTTITGGILQVGNAGTTGTLGLGAVTNDGTLAFNRSDGYTVANVISGSGAVNQSGAGTTTLTGTNTYTGDTTISAGTLQLGDGTTGNDGSIAGAIVNNSNLTFNTFGAGSYAGALSGTGDLSKLGTGTQTIDGTYVLSAATNINVASNGDTAPELTISSDIGASGNRDITKTGAGTLLLTGDNSAGPVGSLVDTDDDGINRLRIDNGVVQFEQANNLGDNSIFISDAANGTDVGVLEFVGTSAATIENQIQLSGSASTNHILRASGTTSAATVEYQFANAGGTGDTLTLDGANTGLNTIGFDLGGLANGLSGGLTKDGAGTWVLKTGVAQTYTGTTTVSSGILIIDGDASAATGDVNVASGATLGGSGTLGGATTIAGSLNPGNSPGLMTFAGDLTLEGTATTTMEIVGAGRGTSFDAIDVGGLLTYGGALVLSADTTIAAGTYDLFGINGTEGGDFASIVLSGAAYSNDALTFDLSDVWTTTLSGTTYTFTQSTGEFLVAVPEPGTFALLAGLTGLVFVMLRRRRA